MPHELSQHVFGSLLVVATKLFWPALAFSLVAVAAHGTRAVSRMIDGRAELRLNLATAILDRLLFVPLLAATIIAAKALVETTGLPARTAPAWADLPVPLVVLSTVFVADFVAYWRHRLEHARLLWPSHALHHSDTAMGWTAIYRFHPVNRLITMLLDGLVLFGLGFPAYAVVMNGLIRHYYGAFIHMDLGWTYGAFGRVFVSPAMHRWHHAADPAAHGKNFATVFCVFDRAFGTFYLPRPCDTPLGVPGVSGRPLLAQLAYPFRPGAYRRAEAPVPTAPLALGAP